jgi:hypothetical protein
MSGSAVHLDCDVMTAARKFTVQGVVTKCERGDQYRVTLNNGHEVLAYRGGKMRKGGQRGSVSSRTTGSRSNSTVTTSTAAGSSGVSVTTAKYGQRHKRRRAAALRGFHPWMPCALCQYPLSSPAGVELDHSPDQKSYRGLAHGTVPCRTCGRKCNRSEAGRRGAAMAGKRPRDRECIICGLPYHTMETATVTCGRTRCVTVLRASRRARQPDPEPPKPTGWVW